MVTEGLHRGTRTLGAGNSLTVFIGHDRDTGSRTLELARTSPVECLPESRGSSRSSPLPHSN